ncbi:hypothetical protein TBLA_0B03580 [Henningerozyma blattae CBS 6284]|uniref:V-type proton ATPase subunit a n=1 Tax=Henningerozyma blattae (strain ATCC 34711 / CBS 6284 / DSM 70876 / NBRC 10599 / NRRL Y-10934 / UCD 77-7) TaxID=1071380 RepID=I2GYJ6_HENB6|nr:hypothetical protein TBLA_0B03580 [Tetrapisispora blattae CBS 6284]CCH59198.1 hypothetical protein TBLA_0B03580 [Tetrapisispora blattae CBS 6284]
MASAVAPPKDEAIFRSAEMSLIEFYISQEIGRDAVYTLGQLGLVQFRDLNSKIRPFQRTFVKEIRNLDNVERQYRYFFKLLLKHDIQLYEDETLIESFKLTQKKDFNIESIQVSPNNSIIGDHMTNATYLETRLLEMEEAVDSLETQKADLEQYRIVLQSGDQFFESIEQGNPELLNLSSSNGNDIETNVLSGGVLPSSVNYVTGVIAREKIGVLEQILWRVLRGNLFFKYLEIEEPIYDSQSKTKIYKNVFIVFSHGDMIMKRIRKISESLDAKLYDVSENEQERGAKLNKVNQSLTDLYTVLQTTLTTLQSELYAIAKELNFWFQDIAREKSVYETLNKFSSDSNRKILIAEGWVPKDQIYILQQCMDQMIARLGIDSPSIIQIVETNKTPPTYHRTNKFTEGFQNICDCYGIAKYREVNAGLPTIVTFPFMFAIMFGDMGHGFLMFLCGLCLVLNESKIDKMKRGEIFDMAYSGRYIVLMMGLFSMYTGFLYNDIFSLSMTFFKSGWEWPKEGWKEGQSIEATATGVYPIGLDWIWHGTENALLFSNSYKMKLSIIMGFIHMSYSYMFSLVNAINFQSMIDIVGNFIPGLIFMQSIFGYLSLTIVYKWSKDWIKDGKPAPGLLNMLINMFLAPGVIDDELYRHQGKVQVVLLFLALICIPWLLIVKPLHYKLTHKEKSIESSDDHETQHLLQSTNNNREEDGDEHLLEIEEHDQDADEDEAAHGEGFSDLMIHQVIYTIEFCLNCVSHTASYLRLWALSLAHAQLSSVLWTMTIKIAFGVPGLLGVLMTVFLFGMWFVLTCTVLVVMEGTSAMLHSLRLHWVESMSKFFVGDGVYYTPFAFQYIDLEDFTAAAKVNTAAAGDE